MIKNNNIFMDDQGDRNFHLLVYFDLLKCELSLSIKNFIIEMQSSISMYFELI